MRKIGIANKISISKIYQNGGTDYMGEAIYAQIFGDGYDYQKGINQAKTWAMLNPEQQAKLVQDAYEAGFFSVNRGQWIETDQQTGNKNPKPNLAKYMQNVVPQLLAGQGAT